MNQEEYDKKFEVNDRESKLLKAAFAQVSDIRKFEIELYWKRATYFWALIAVAFAGYFSILASEHMPNKFFLGLIISCVGFVFTFAWFLASRGSKYWQENWENHLDLLENNVTGPLYKTLLERPSHINLAEKLVTGPLSMSVSKINQWVSVFVVFSWGSLVIFSAYKSLILIGVSKDQWLVIGAHTLVIVVAFVVCFMMLNFGKTHRKKHSPTVIERETEIE
ncbi:hypothetical protein [Vibrio pectenicida]|uniref:Uncharacterized protein n=1 Tax=Vibrio pectenicida TaxID=62763 RepID=A0A427U2L2_9VIBR|nr:hypothetical protein [Vibrio pectenicida]RSD30865.1 hypothetical protein EJA03_11815 [Vibrio pectenicida]